MTSKPLQAVVVLSRGLKKMKRTFASLGNLRCWVASGFMASGLCSAIALAMTLLEATVSTGKQHHYQKRHCEVGRIPEQQAKPATRGNDKCIDGDIKPEAI